MVSLLASECFGCYKAGSEGLRCTFTSLACLCAFFLHVLRENASHEFFLVETCGKHPIRAFFCTAESAKLTTKSDVSVATCIYSSWS
ncbi:hypothetical protein DUNSADRAFT_17857 [Dunaliella salina]|uniref:Encoded protein n=1 Tax=Dunaliella salina TaxID=3046 RepID=A0ABQ7G105_DUNSA|nr:hypothetical protein DUNSADRAFT_17857 [Dunaliella salina]|eukprot:KAF5828283.1 hypothetical protein DUNSADRAFT_17857 [Dunaliella salina]